VPAQPAGSDAHSEKTHAPASVWRVCTGVYGEPVPQPTARGFELPEADPWVQLQRTLLACAQAHGNENQVKWYQRVLGME